MDLRVVDGLAARGPNVKCIRNSTCFIAFHASYIITEPSYGRWCPILIAG